MERESRAAVKRRRFQLRTGAIVLGVAAVLAACALIYNSPLFSISRVEVAGVKHLTADRVRQLAKVPAGSTLLRFPADEVASRVSADPWVESVSVSRVFPNGMRIRVTERQPVAVVQTDKGTWLADRNSYLIAPASNEATFAGIPAIGAVPGLVLKAGRTTSPELRNAIAVLTGISPQLASAVKSMSAPTVDGTSVLTKDRVEIVFGEAVDLPVKDAGARRILQEQRGRVVSIDVRSVDRMTWRGMR